MDLIIAWFENFKGELAALTGAFLWAWCSMAFRFLGTTIPPLQLNFLKRSFENVRYFVYKFCDVITSQFYFIKIFRF